MTARLAIDDGDVRVWLGDVIDGLHEMPDGLAQTCVTSPPYWGLRDYGEAGQIGLEATPDEYVARMVEVFREVWRVLRDDGTLWLNLGDSYNTAPAGNTKPSGFSQIPSYWTGGAVKYERGVTNANGLKPKDLIGIPWRVAFALQADGWYLRSDIIWAKPNPMPESVTDRPTKSHEYVFLLSKSQRYFYDAEAIREQATTKVWPGIGPQHGAVRDRGEDYEPMRVNDGRNARSVWQITTKPYAEAHFATFPIELPERCILAATSEAGACAACGAPHERVIVATAPDGREAIMRGGKTRDADGKPLMGDNMIDHGTRGSFNSSGATLARRTAGWQPTCSCNAGIVSQIVLDPFMGSGTTAWVARHLGRNAVGCELNAEYVEIAARRLRQLSLLGAES